MKPVKFLSYFRVHLKLKNLIDLQRFRKPRFIAIDILFFAHLVLYPNLKIHVFQTYLKELYLTIHFMSIRQ